MVGRLVPDLLGWIETFGARLEEQPVTVEVKHLEKDGLLIADVILPGGSVLNQELVGAGLAWRSQKFSKSPVLAALEQDVAGSFIDPDGRAATARGFGIDADKGERHGDLLLPSYGHTVVGWCRGYGALVVLDAF